MLHKQIYHSDKYKFEYRHVMLPKDIAKLIPKTRFMSESEWRNPGVQKVRDGSIMRSMNMNFTSYCSDSRYPRSQTNEAGELLFSLKLTRLSFLLTSF
ncbi:Cyclin-dependent kinases regulatory subunit 1 [Fukomys damarensis]|uniref:Cyclin-dependent kinases regulatory subunit n=1 Tax=Fukomys damarensis TaxID=885580 RepID=A0A091DSN6_FUKDA|nr:Cyclin-dependent kinases regulatory subunit 1 [Fukomys damarensis]